MTFLTFRDDLPLRSLIRTAVTPSRTRRGGAEIDKKKVLTLPSDGDIIKMLVVTVTTAHKEKGGYMKCKRSVWYIYRPTYMGRVEPPALWRLERVVAGSERDKMLASGRTVNDAGELVELPGEWRRFLSRAEAEAWMHAEASLWS